MQSLTDSQSNQQNNEQILNDIQNLQQLEQQLFNTLETIEIKLKYILL